MAHPFSADDLRQLQEHGVVIFADRIIYQAQPPVSQARIAEIQQQCAAPLPAALIELWQLTAGGSLAYDLRAEMDGNDEALSWSELFYDDSDGYRDLAGWIEHEQECAEEAATDQGQQWHGLLRYLPIGGFEYCDRIYVDLKDGSVVAWKQGLPGWTHSLQSDAIATLAPDLKAGFAALVLETDPESDLDSPGTMMLEYLDERVADHGMPQALMDKLLAFYRLALLDWQSPLQAGTLGGSPRLAAIALRDAIQNNNPALIGQLAAQAVALDAPIGGSALPVDVALMHKSFDAAFALLQAGAPVSADALHRIDSLPPLELVAALLAHGAQADSEGLLCCAACGAPEAARLIAQAAAELPDYQEVLQGKLQRYRDDLKKVRAGKLGHYLGAAGLAERVKHLESFTL